ncbi:helix-turn-helix domain-containing protein [Parapedobacter tibetensis]|uniref:helix-turn-helix domain-containing protein n=1 Tax=Parapedobacter tibetensis TaxID=2972951 RepID=UPI00214D46B3|nr:helix-turn-helix domain-containing protein [Parapedobacter tibetensis]
MNTTAPHFGRRIAFLRGLYRMTQGQLGEQSGFKQQEVSDFEGKPELADEVLMRLLGPLGITIERFKEMDEGAFGSTVYHVHDQAQAFGPFNTNNFNPIEKVVELAGKNEELYERLLEAEKEKNVYLQRLLDNN